MQLRGFEALSRISYWIDMIISQIYYVDKSNRYGSKLRDISVAIDFRGHVTSSHPGHPKNNSDYTLSLAPHSTPQNLDPLPYIQWGVLTTFVKSNFLRSSKLDAWRCIKSFTPEDKHRHLFICVLLVPEYLVWFVSSCTAQADTAAPQHHSCFSVHSTELDWRTVRPTQYQD